MILTYLKKSPINLVPIISKEMMEILENEISRKVHLLMK